MKMLETYYKEITGGIDANALKDLLAMDVTPAAKWFLQESEQEYWEYTRDFPCIVPPSPLTWIEFEAPDRIESSERVVINSQLKRAGILAMTFEIKPEARRYALEADMLLPHMQMLYSKARRGVDWEGDRAYRQKHMQEALDAQVLPRWITIWNEIIEPISTRGIIPFGLFGMYLDETGRVIQGLNSCISAISEESLAQLQADDGDLFSDMLPFMFSLSLSHCKNVTARDNVLPAAVLKKRQKNGQQAIVFRTLDIKPMRQQIKRTTEGGKSDSKRAMHFIRGHMKTFSADKPLFGKHTGTYWWSLNVRGDEAEGTVQKDYRVQPA